MNLLMPIEASTMATLAAVLGGLMVLAYILKMRRRRFEVPFSTLWQRVLKEKEATSLWKHLKRILSLLLLLTILGLLLVAAMEPISGERDEDARSVVILIDTSASMKTADSAHQEGDTRLDDAKAAVMEILDGMGDGDAVMLMRMDGRTTPLTRFQSDIPRLKRTLQTIHASDTPANLSAALSAAADALRERQKPEIVIVGDGAYDEEALQRVLWEPVERKSDEGAIPPENKTANDLSAVDLSGISVSYSPVGQAADNVAIVGFNVRRYISNKLNYEVFIELQNFSKEPKTRRLVLFNGDEEIDVKEIQLAPGERISKIYEDLGGGDDSVLKARLEALTESDSDAFTVDDEAWALIPASKKQRVLLVSEDNLYMEGALLIFENLEVDKLAPPEYESMFAKSELPDYDAVIFHEYTPEKVPPSPTHLMYMRPSGEHSPFPVKGSLERGRITGVSQTHPIARWLELDDVNFDSIDVLEVDRAKAEVPVATSIRSTVAAAKKEGRRKIAAFGFGLTGTDIMLRAAFPLLIVNTMDWFAGSDSDLITTYQTGRRVKVPLDGTYGMSEAKVTRPTGAKSRAPLSEGYATFYAADVGLYGLSVFDGDELVASIQLASNLTNPQESDIEPSAELHLGGVKLEAPKPGKASRPQGLWTYLVLFVLLLLLVEWFTFNRRITV